MFNKSTVEKLKLKTAVDVESYLLNQSEGTANMLYLRQVNEGKITWTFHNRLLLKMVYLKEYFPSIGIWWNNNGYPDKRGIRRNECAFEPIPGSTSALQKFW